MSIANISSVSILALILPLLLRAPSSYFLLVFKCSERIPFPLPLSGSNNSPQVNAPNRALDAVLCAGLQSAAWKMEITLYYESITRVKSRDWWFQILSHLSLTVHYRQNANFSYWHHVEFRVTRQLGWKVCTYGASCDELLANCSIVLV